MVTIKDIAREANVSFATVSYVLNDKFKKIGITEQLAQKVKEIADRMGYSRNAVATNMRNGKTKVIAFISSDISQEYTSKVLDGASMAIDRNHFFLKLITIKKDNSLKISIERLLEQRPSGLILRGISAVPLEFISNIAQSHDIPIACVDNYSNIQGTINVVSDDTIGMESIVEHLHSLGHQRIAHIANGFHLGFAARRYQGFRQGMKKCGLAVDEALVLEGLYETSPGEFHAFIQKIVSGEILATAITVSTDFQALTAMNILQSSGKKVPGDISIAGYGDMLFSQSSFPALTTVKQPFEKMGMTAANELIKAIRGEPFESTIEVPTELVIRDSTGPAKFSTIKNRNQVKSE